MARGGTDEAAKERLLAQLPNGQHSGNLYQSSIVSIDYVQGPDLFQVEVLTTNVAQAKAQAVAWFEQKGFSQEGICHLPLSFYLNFQVSFS